MDLQAGEIYRDQLYVGDCLMGKAITEEDEEKSTVFLPEYEDGSGWYRRHQSELYSSGDTITIDTEITETSEVPIFVKAGSIIPEYCNLKEDG